MNNDYTLWKQDLDGNRTFITSFSDYREAYKYIYNYKKENNIDVPYIREIPLEDGVKIDYGSYSDYFVIINKDFWTNLRNDDRP